MRKRTAQDILDEAKKELGLTGDNKHFIFGEDLVTLVAAGAGTISQHKNESDNWVTDVSYQGIVFQHTTSNKEPPKVN